MKRLVPHPLFLLAMISAFFVAIGSNFDRPPEQYQHVSVERAFLQLGVFGLVLSVLFLPLVFTTGETRRAAFAKLKTWATVAVISLLIPFIAGEAFLRVLYWNGESFGSHGGPLVRRFEHGFEFNRFDGPSRGPEVTGPKANGEVRLLIQGDSITWGQGVREEATLYSSRLLEKLRAANPNVGMAVLAKPGREIDGHLEQLRKWGGVIQPDAIIYQWYVNDMEIDKSKRPVAPGRFWRYMFLHYPLVQRSYLYFFLDYHLDLLLPAGRRSYATYIDEEFAEGTPAWNLFVRRFQEWATEAKSLTPRVLVAFYPHIVESATQFADLIQRMERLCREQGIRTIDFSTRFDAFSDDYTRIYATPFDAHPSAAVHAVIAEALHDRLRQLWPELFAAQTEDLAGSDALTRIHGMDASQMDRSLPDSRPCTGCGACTGACGV